MIRWEDAAPPGIYPDGTIYPGLPLAPSAMTATADAVQNAAAYVFMPNSKDPIAVVPQSLVHPVRTTSFRVSKDQDSWEEQEINLLKDEIKNKLAGDIQKKRLTLILCISIRDSFVAKYRNNKHTLPQIQEKIKVLLKNLRKEARKKSPPKSKKKVVNAQTAGSASTP